MLAFVASEDVYSVPYAHACTPREVSLSKKDRTNLDSHTAAADNFAGLALLVNLAQASPFTKLLVVIDSHQLDAVLCTQSLYKFDVHRLITVVGQHTQVSLAPAERFVNISNSSSNPELDI